MGRVEGDNKRGQLALGADDHLDETLSGPCVVSKNALRWTILNFLNLVTSKVGESTIREPALLRHPILRARTMNLSGALPT
jgi:hypothetical protein